ncbi:glycosyltransferase family 39 protein [Phragmitibacter flavus]|uniref:Glycosyltransferase family 39 protein n=1 Tax=Phragmitibacter flavus TaxID=2576071 RepID=A0A5R8K9V2_9BACT|nr:glycosyltransferase family 39 protein [Phragmitibacter flavus]TLD69090.1 glycosyltransferase family 39 protein [Phragmitibacter flavus]
MRFQHGIAKLTIWHLLLVLAALRLLLLPWFCHITDLAGDESYYWEWGRRPAWGYFSKPPMIGWLMGLTGWLSNHQEWAIRLASLLFGTTSLAMLMLLARRMFGEAAARWTLLLTAMTPANVALNLFFTIDAPLILFWSASLLVFWMAMEHPKRGSLWCLLTLTLGLGYLSKQMMLVFPVLMLFFAALNPGTRVLLRHGWFWGSLCGSLLFFIPVLRWNQQHDWITVQHTREHFTASEQAGWWQKLADFLSFPLSQAGLLTPLTWLLLMAVLAVNVWCWRSIDLRQRYLVFFAAPGLLVFFGMAMRQGINPNWPAVFYLSAMVLLAAILQRPSLTPLRGWSQRLAKPALLMALICTLLSYTAPLIVDLMALSGHAKLDPLRRLRGWSDAGQQAQAWLDQSPNPSRTFLLVLGHRDNASQMAFYTPSHPRVYRWQPDGKAASQYELWPSAHERLGDDALILQPPDKKFPSQLRRAFQSIEPLGTIDAPAGKHQGRQWQVWLARKLQSWPVPDRLP